jgi:hypothetical protein
VRTDALTVLTPVVEGRVPALRQAIAAWPQGAESPFARVFGTHLARLTVVDALDDRDLRPDPSAGSFLLFSTDFDGVAEVHVERLRSGLGEDADRVWSHCAGYPGHLRARPFRKWMLEHRIPVGFSVAPYKHHGVEEVREALALRRRLVDFAVGAADLDSPALKSAWLRAFGDRRGAA